MLRRIFIFVLLGLGLVHAGNLSAQSTGSFRNRLSLPDTLYNSRIVVTEKGDAGAVVKSLEARETKAAKIKGYRVRIFFDNKQNARVGATATKNRFSELFPDIPVHINYENPYWKVAVGNCLTNEEAIILWGRVKSLFELAFIMREDIPLSAFGER